MFRKTPDAMFAYGRSHKAEIPRARPREGGFLARELPVNLQRESGAQAMAQNGRRVELSGARIIRIIPGGGYRSINRDTGKDGPRFIMWVGGAIVAVTLAMWAAAKVATIASLSLL